MAKSNETPLDLIDSIHEQVDGAIAIVDLLHLQDDKKDPLCDATRGAAAYTAQTMLRNARAQATQLFELTKQLNLDGVRTA
jgi:hypothetical protein